MAQYSYKNINKFRHIGVQSDCVPNTETLREKILRSVLKKQFNTNLSLDDCQSNKYKFVSSSKQKSVTEVVEGLKSLEHFKEVANDFSLREVLSSCHFDSREIEYLISGNESLSSAGPEACAGKLAAIETKLQQRLDDLNRDRVDSFSGAITLNRHEYEEECKYLATDVIEKLTPCLIKLQPHSHPSLHPDHPMNKICELANDLFPEEISKQTTVSKDVEGASPHNPPEISKKEHPMIRHFDSKPNTYWDMKEIPVVKQKLKTNMLPHGCENEKPRLSLRVVKSESMIKPDFTKPFVWTLDPSQLVSLEDIEKNRVDVKTIQKDPKFAHYTPGEPSKTLFLKNLPRKLDPLSIIRLFGHFERDKMHKIEYRILGGKMKGQAFIKFCDIAVSQLAFSTCNGYLLEGNPIIIEYTKKK